ncbi:class I SAM-dependent methyltransferase [Aliagarivorans taiwanensis]|uniref:class I SAM-dependent methyltransferase n=1 Tax=Aliagarivorans taiwanensis TaxID=561966 RepID=UPI00041DA340|nr:DUF4942 domain-containing protein [Aliagarivorans taiwanensis]
MTQSTHALVSKLKQQGQDFEFYPTTSAQIAVIEDDIRALVADYDIGPNKDAAIRLLDVGAGDGRVLKALSPILESGGRSVAQFAIEKASVHIRSYRGQGITLLGTDLHETNLISKNSDVAFTNPPYSEFVPWMVRMIGELSFAVLYAVIPTRWADDEHIQEAISARGSLTATVLASSDFVDAERQARAKVDVVRFAFNDFAEDAERIALWSERRSNYRYRPTLGANMTCPFQCFILRELGLKQTYSETLGKFREYQELERVRAELKEPGTEGYELVKSEGILTALLANYEARLQHFLTQYKAIGGLDASLLQEMGVEHNAIKEGLQAKLYGLRNVYWGLLFEKLDVLTSKLISSHSSKLLDTLKANQLDFTRLNALYIIEYAVGMANELVEESLVKVYRDLTSEESIHRYYVSNQHVYSDDWRHTKTKDLARYLLDYRFIHSGTSDTFENGLGGSSKSFCNNLKVMFGLLGYSGVELDTPFEEIASGQAFHITGRTPTGGHVTLCQLRIYMKGTRHIKFDQEAMLRLNVTASRLLGWVRNKEEFQEQAAWPTAITPDVWALSDDMKLLPQQMLALADKRAA